MRNFFIICLYFFFCFIIFVGCKKDSQSAPSVINMWEDLPIENYNYNNTPHIRGIVVDENDAPMPGVWVDLNLGEKRVRT